MEFILEIDGDYEASLEETAKASNLNIEEIRDEITNFRDSHDALMEIPEKVFKSFGINEKQWQKLKKTFLFHQMETGKLPKRKKN